MGIVNVTPDSFSDGGRFLGVDAAVAHGVALVAAGSALLDVGGESTRPGAAPVDLETELARVLPVIEGLVRRVTVPISVDTTKAAVARAALGAGATVVNDVSAGRHDPAMLDTVAAAGAGLVLMHMQGEPATMQDDPRYDDVVAEVGDFLVERIAAARDAGVAPDAIIADPGIGFAKTAAHNLELLAALAPLAARLGVPLLVGTSRKSFLRSFGAGPDADARDDATLATTVWAFTQGAAIVRVHDGESSARAARLLEVMAAAGTGIRPHLVAEAV
jgi:dihydropteroate synthase